MENKNIVNNICFSSVPEEFQIPLFYKVKRLEMAKSFKKRPKETTQRAETAAAGLNSRRVNEWHRWRRIKAETETFEKMVGLFCPLPRAVSEVLCKHKRREVHS